MSEARFAAEPGFCVHATNVSRHPAMAVTILGVAGTP